MSMLAGQGSLICLIRRTVLEEEACHCGVVYVCICGGDKGEASGPTHEAGNHDERRGSEQKHNREKAMNSFTA